MKHSNVETSPWLVFALGLYWFISQLPAFAASAGAYRLPPSAKIKITSKGNDDQSSSMTCEELNVLTPKRVRELFASYRLVDGVELHKYLWAPCFAQGTIEIQGKSFFWKFRPGNTLATDFPDGKSKILGGSVSDDSSAR